MATSTAASCSTRACSDYGTSSDNCAYYTSGCAWSSVATSCYSKAATCGDYTIPDTFKTTELLKAKYCASLISTAKKTPCAYLSGTSTIACSAAPGLCTGVAFPVTVTDDQDKATFCINSLNENGARCAYSANFVSACAVLAPCDAYAPYDTAAVSDLVH